jgi:Zn-finger nucleic acid-binding protein
MPIGDLWKQVEGRPEPFSMRCHDCHAPLSRTDAACASCGWKNVLDCPDCARPMSVESHAGLRLDVCKSCKGIWFDHHELETIWGGSFDRALQRRNLSRRDALGSAADASGDVLFNALFFAPDLVYLGGYAAANVAAASVEAMRGLPGAIGSAPEVAASTFEAVGEAAGNVFEVILSIIAGFFD